MTAYNHQTFDQRLTKLQQDRNTSQAEQDAAITVFERLVTARAIAQTVLVDASGADILAIAAAIAAASTKQVFTSDE